MNDYPEQESWKTLFQIYFLLIKYAASLSIVFGLCIGFFSQGDNDYAFPGVFVFLIIVAVGLLLSGLVMGGFGYLIARNKNLGIVTPIMMGMILGPLGWIFLAIIKGKPGLQSVD